MVILQKYKCYIIINELQYITLFYSTSERKFFPFHQVAKNKKRYLAGNCLRDPSQVTS